MFEGRIFKRLLTHAHYGPKRVALSVTFVTDSNGYGSDTHATQTHAHKPPSGVGIAVGDRLAGPGPAGGAPGPPTAAGHAQQRSPHPRQLHEPRASDLTPP